MSVQYDPSKDNLWLSVGHSVIGDVHRTLTNKLLRDRWLVCDALLNARVFTEVHGGTWTPVPVYISKDGEPYSPVEEI